MTFAEQLASDRAFAAEQRALLARIDENFARTVMAMASGAQPPPKDVTAQSSRMPRNAALAYKNKRPKDADSPSYLGVLKLQNGDAFWVGLWPRTVNGEPVVEIRLTKKN